MSAYGYNSKATASKVLALAQLLAQRQSDSTQTVFGAAGGIVDNGNPGVPQLGNDSLGLSIAYLQGMADAILTYLGGSTWTAPTLQNSWTNYGSGYNPAGYFIDAFGIVHLRGLVTGGAAGSTIFTLPSGFLPANQQLFAAISDGGAYGIGRIDVDTSGHVIATVIQASGAWISLDGLTFATF